VLAGEDRGSGNLPAAANLGRLAATVLNYRIEFF
jgi:hypothetical protein